MARVRRTSFSMGVSVGDLLLSSPQVARVERTDGWSRFAPLAPSLPTGKRSLGARPLEANSLVQFDSATPAAAPRERRGRRVRVRLRIGIRMGGRMRRGEGRNDCHAETSIDQHQTSERGWRAPAAGEVSVRRRRFTGRALAIFLHMCERSRLLPLSSFRVRSASARSVG